MILKKNTFVRMFLIVLSLNFFLLLPAYSAQFFFGTDSSEVQIGRTFEVGVFVDSEEELINAFEGVITFPDSVRAVGIREANSIVSNWIVRPAYYSTTSSRGVGFAGIVPGGFAGRGYLFSILLESMLEGDIEIGTQSELILMSDGNGTPLPYTPAPLRLTSVVSSSRAVDIVVPEDIVSPEDFIPTVTTDPNLYDGEMVVIFSTTDKGSGIIRYEVAEKRVHSWTFGTLTDSLEWYPATSPYVLLDQSGYSTIFVKAIDTFGNERIVSLAPQYEMTYEKYLWWCILALISVGGIFFAIRYVRKKKNR
jgi:hypothetical protein